MITKFRKPFNLIKRHDTGDILEVSIVDNSFKFDNIIDMSNEGVLKMLVYYNFVKPKACLYTK